jgi:LmbE family N-acetylglucosaminyl deacetylase
VDVSSTIEDKATAVSCHRSQFPGDAEWAADAVRLRAAEDGKRAGVAFAEGFRRLRLSI